MAVNTLPNDQCEGQKLVHLCSQRRLQVDRLPGLESTDTPHFLGLDSNGILPFPALLALLYLQQGKITPLLNLPLTVLYLVAVAEHSQGKTGSSVDGSLTKETI